MSEAPQQGHRSWSSDRIAGVSLVAATALVLSILSPRCWPVLLIDGFTPLLVLTAALGWGIWPVKRLLKDRLNGLQQSCVALGLGLGITSTLTLLLGMLGLLSQVTGLALIIGGLSAGFFWIAKHDRTRDQHPIISMSRRSTIACGLLVLPVGYALGVLLFLATLPPGMVWLAEGFGYDVLEYHLQVQREYFDRGQIHFLPHNVYANFPQLVEIHFLLLMHLLGSPAVAAIPAQIFHAALMIASVLALGAFTPPGWARHLVWLIAGSVPALIHTGCLAYVEGGLLLYAVLAGGLAKICLREAELDTRTGIVLGVLGGLAGATKYTGLALVAAPLVLVVPLLSKLKLARRMQLVLLVGSAAFVAASPWLARNTLFTGNPVFPFAYELFGGEAWSPAQDEQWDTGHQLPAEHRPFVARMQLAYQELVGSGMFGFGLVLLALTGAIARPDRATLMLAGWGVIMVCFWMTLTHMPWRFLTPLVAPLALLLGQLLDWRGSGHSLYDNHGRHEAPLWLRSPVVVVAVIAALWQLDHTRSMLINAEKDTQRRFQSLEFDLASTVGATDLFRVNHPVNQLTPESSVIWQVGDAAVLYVERTQHYFVTFNRDPWLEFAAEHSASESLDFLRSRNVTHVVFSWPEIERLRNTYGFSPLVTRAWLSDLIAAGLNRVDAEDGSPALLEIYELPKQEPAKNG